MPVLMWEKPRRAESTEEWKSRSADSAPPGVYTPNMSEADMQRWKARMVGKRKDDPRVEIRKTATYTPAGQSERGYYAQMLIIVWPSSRVRISMNGTADMTAVEWTEMQMAIDEALRALAGVSNG